MLLHVQEKFTGHILKHFQVTLCISTQRTLNSCKKKKSSSFKKFLLSSLPTVYDSLAVSAEHPVHTRAHSKAP